jgi:hypothetical protein
MHSFELVEGPAGGQAEVTLLAEGRFMVLPVAYPAANSPQAWAAGSIVLVVRTLLGIEPSGAELATAPLPGAPRCRLPGVPFRGRWLALRSGGRFRRGPRPTATDFADAA